MTSKVTKVAGTLGVLIKKLFIAAREHIHIDKLKYTCTPFLWN